MAVGDPRLTLVAIVFLGVALRLSEVATRDLWEDEAYSVRISESAVPDIVERSISDTHPPLYYLVLHYWTALFGDSEFAVRAPSIIFGAATIVAVYAVGRLLASAKAALLAALLVALSTFHLNYSIEARMYSMLAFLATASFYFFIVCRRNPSRRSSIGYFVASAALIYTHVYGLFILIAQNAFVFTHLVVVQAGCEKWRSTYRSWAPAQLALIVVFLPWLIVMIGQVGTEIEGRAAAKLDPEVFSEPSARQVLDTLRFYAGGWAGLALLGVLGLLTLAPGLNLSSWRSRTRGTEHGPPPSERQLGASVVLLSLWLASPILLPFVASHLVTPIYHDRQTIAASIGLFLLVAMVLAGMRRRLYFAASVCLLVLSSAYYLHRYQPFNVQEWQRAASFVDERGSPGDLLVFDSLTARDAFAYYSKREHLFGEFVAQGSTDPRIRTLAGTATQHPRAWLIVKPDFITARSLRRVLTGDYEERFRRGPDPPFTGLQLTLFASTSRAAGP